MKAIRQFALVVAESSGTLSPSFHRGIGAGTEPFTAMARERWPIKFTGSAPTVRSKCLP